MLASSSQSPASFKTAPTPAAQTYNAGLTALAAQAGYHRLINDTVNFNKALLSSLLAWILLADMKLH